MIQDSLARTQSYQTHVLSRRFANGRLRLYVAFQNVRPQADGRAAASWRWISATLSVVSSPPPCSRG